MDKRRSTKALVKSEKGLSPNLKKKRTAKRSSPKKNNRNTIIVICLVIAIVSVIGVLVMYRAETARLAEEHAKQLRLEEEARQLKQKQDTERYQHIMNYDVFVEGISVNGIPIGGKTLQDGISYIRNTLDFKPLSGQLVFRYQNRTFSFDLSRIIVTDNVTDVLKQALSDVRSDDMYQTLNKADFIGINGKDYTVSISKNTSAVGAFIGEIADSLDKDPVNASITEIDTDNHTINMASSSEGIRIDRATLADLALSAIESDSFEPIEIPYQTVPPTVSSEDLQFIEIGAETKFNGSSSSRIYNIKKGAKLINGTILKPGETFSCNDTLGVRTEKNGWKMANAYVGGTTEEQAGGGVCQLSSTLYNCAVKADLKIISRTNHSMPVSYIDKGLDATINSVGNKIDFKFRNNTGCDIVIFAWTVEKKLYFKIYRIAFDTDEYDEIRLTSKKLETLKPTGDMEVIQDPTLSPGEEVVDVARQNGSIWRSYKNYYKNGELIRTEKLDESTYKPFNGSMRIGPVLN